MEPDRKLSLRLLRAIVRDEKTTLFGKVNCYGGYVMFGMSAFAIAQYFGGALELSVNLGFVKFALSGPSLQDAIVAVAVVILTVVLWSLCLLAFTDFRQVKK